MVSVKTLRTVFFYLAYLTFLIFSTFGHIPTLGGYLKLLPSGGIFILCILFLSGIKRYTKHEIQILSFLFIYSFVLIGSAHYFALFKLILLIATSKGIDFCKCVKFDMFSRIIMSVTMIFLYLQGIAPDITSYYEGHLRHSMGFENPNHVGIMAFIIVIEIIYLYQADLGLIQYGIILGIMFFIDSTAGSRTAELMIIFTLIVVTMYKLFPSLFKRKGTRLIMKYTPSVCAIVTFIGSYLYLKGNALANVFNFILSGRLANNIYYYKMFGFSLFGTDTSIAGRTNDNLYGYCWIGLGIITFFLFMYFYIRMIDRLFENNKPMVIILICLMIYGLSERLWMNVDYNIMMLSFRTLLYHDLDRMEVKCMKRRYRIKLGVK